MEVGKRADELGENLREGTPDGHHFPWEVRSNVKLAVRRRDWQAE